MRPSKFLLSLLSLAGCGLASSQELEQSQQSCPSTVVDPVELVTTFAVLTSISQYMGLELLQLNKTTTVEIVRDLMEDMWTESYTLFKYAQRLENTPLFDPNKDTPALAMGFAKWKRHTSDFLVRVGQSSETFRNNFPESTLAFITNLGRFKKATNVFFRRFQAITPDLDRYMALQEPVATETLPATIEHTIRSFTNKKKQAR